MVLRGGGLSLLFREPAPGFFCLPGEVVGRADMAVIVPDGNDSQTGL